MCWRVLAGVLTVLALSVQPLFAQTGRFQVVSVGSPAIAILLDTVTGCTWHLAELPDSRRLWFGFLPREGLPRGADKTEAMVPKECVSFDGVVPGAPRRGSIPK